MTWSDGVVRSPIWHVEICKILDPAGQSLSGHQPFLRGMVQFWEHLPSTNVAWVQFWHGSVITGLTRLALSFFWVFQFFSLLFYLDWIENLHLHGTIADLFFFFDSNMAILFYLIYFLVNIKCSNVVIVVLDDVSVPCRLVLQVYFPRCKEHGENHCFSWL